MTQSGQAEADPFAFIGHDGDCATLLRNFDWSKTPLGRVETWSPALKTASALLIHSPVPIVMLWGQSGVMIYNDAYSIFAGHRHPGQFGLNVRDAWPEVADFNDNVMKVGLAGGTLAYRDQELTLYRKGYPEQVWMNLDYSPVLDEQGHPAGVIAVVVETTERVLAERRNRDEFQRLQNLFEQAPTFMAMVSGSDFRFEMANPDYLRLVGERELVGRTVQEALPEVVDQGYLDILIHVRATGTAHRRNAERVMLRRQNGSLEERLLDFVFQPIRDDSGEVSHIFIQGSDVTERLRAEEHQRLLINELNHRVKNTLSSVQSIVSQTLRITTDSKEATRAITSRIMALSAAHNVLTRENWASARLRMVVDAAIAPFIGAEGGTIRVSGPDMQVGPHAAISLALALHELGTNAVKYGALSVGEGRVDLSWQREADGAFTLDWIESGGPAVAPAAREGFGSRLILQVLPQQLNGTAEIELRPEGAAFHLHTSVAALSDRPVLD